MKKYRICMLCDTLDLGGAETHIVTLANTLASLGHEVFLVAEKGRLCHCLKNVHFKRLPLNKKRFSLFSFFALWRFFRRQRFDVVHAHTRYTAFLCRLLVRARLVTTAHWVFDTTFPKKQFTCWGEETIAVSDDISEYLEDEYGLKKEQITISSNGIDTEKFVGEKEDGVKRKIVYCSRLSPDRADAAFALLDAIEKLPFHLFSLTILGDGDCFPNLKKRAEEISARHPACEIHLLGGVADVESYLKDCDIFVGVSRAALEALSAECAVVLAGNEGYLSVFSSKDDRMARKSNFCCRGAEQTDSEKLFRDLKHLLSLSWDALRKMGKENRTYAQRNFSNKKMAEDALSVYDKICKRRVVLCGYYGFDNIGDELLLQVLKESLSEKGYRNVHLLSWHHLSFSAFSAMRKRYDFILGGGNLLQDNTSRRSLWFYLFCMRRAKGRLYIYGGIGPLSREGEKKIAPYLMRAEGVFCRTVNDQRRAERIANCKTVLSADAVLSISVPKKKQGEKILLTLRAPHPNEILAATAFVLSLCRSFGKENLLLFSMHPKDAFFAESLAKRYHIPLCASRKGNVFLSLLSECRAVFSTRLHGGICALAAGVPFFLGDGEEKCRDFICDLKKIAPDATFYQSFSYGDRPLSLPESNQDIEKAKKSLLARFQRESK